MTFFKAEIFSADGWIGVLLNSKETNSSTYTDGMRQFKLSASAVSSRTWKVI